jgi:hypothetical protein
VAKFKLCQNNDCGSCRNAGEYIVDMKEFIETYQEAQKEANEYVCENANYECETACENGYNYYNNNNNNANYYYNNNNGGGNNNNNNNCVYYCLVDKKLDFCIEGDQGGQGQQNVNEMAECRPLNEQEGGNNNNNNNKNNNYYNNYSTQTYYVGAYCTSSGVYVGTFTDSTCTKHAPSGTYEKYMYGYSLPTTPLVSTGCLSCNGNNNNNNNGGNNNNNNNYNNYNGGNSVSETCLKLYEGAAKCEKNVKGVTYPDTSGCEMINTILPKISSAFKSATGGPSVAKICAWTFGIGFVALAGYVVLLHRKVMRQKRELEANGYVFTPSTTKPGGFMS